LVECHGVEADESVLTGESRPSRKDAESIMRESVPVAERRNMLHAGTVITRGRGTAVVVSTGMDTQMGLIAGMISGASEGATPLQRRLAQLGRWLVLGCLLICAAVAALGIARGESVQSMFMAGVSLAVAAIPEGLPAIVTISLALGVQRMSARHAVIRRLSAVETLGCATVICADKTGTLTRNEMTVVAVDLIDRQLRVTGSGYAPEGEFREVGGTGAGAGAATRTGTTPRTGLGRAETVPAERRIEDPSSDPILRDLLLCAALCNDASLTREQSGQSTPPAGSGRLPARRKTRIWDVVGDPTEGALLAMAHKGGLAVMRRVRSFARVSEIPFEPERRMMAVACEGPEGVFTFVKGAPQTVLELCDSRYVGRERAARDARFDREVLARNSDMARGSMRVLASACARGNLIEERAGADARVHPHLTFLGLTGMMDPPRPEAVKSVERARRAGIRTIMITGDHAETAEAIAVQTGLISPDQLADGRARSSLIISGEQLDTASDQEAMRMVDTAAVFARVAPAHKLRIVRALRQRGHIVAMTGDGVNDAPAIREADIGISMGLKGTDVAREASSMVLGDDNYATIIAAIEEGRSIYDNIRKFIRYLLASNVGEVGSMLLTAMVGLPLPLTPIQLLWMNLMTDGLPAMALAADPTDPEAMSRPPRRPDEGVFAHGLGLKIIAQGAFIGLCTIACYILAGLALGHDLPTARTMAFCTLVMSQLIYVFHCRSERHSASEVGLGSNRLLVAAVAVSVALQVAGVQLPVGHTYLGTRPLSLIDWALVLFLSGWSVVLTAAARAVRRAARRRFHRFKVRNAKKTG
jgi:Ca2+-transporting ATPase